MPDDDIIKHTKTFSINNDKSASSLIVHEYKIPSFKYIKDNAFIILMVICPKIKSININILSYQPEKL